MWPAKDPNLFITEHSEKVDKLYINIYGTNILTIESNLKHKHLPVAMCHLNQLSFSYLMVIIKEGY